MAVTAGWRLFDTAIGRCGIAWRGEVVVGVQLPEDDDRATMRRLRAKAGGATAAVAPGPTVAAAIESITSLLAGDDVDLGHVEVDLSTLGPFERSVLDLTRTIPRGEVRTYGEVARALGDPSAARAVGRALGANPVPIVVPCHRVVGAGGKLVGFSANGGIETKRRMLLIEGCPAVAPSLFD